MYAIIETGGKQYKVQKDDVLAVEKLSANGGDKVQFNSVLLTGGKATVIEQIKDKKVISFVKRRRKSSSKSKKGHRQQITLVRITDILEAGADKTNVQEAKSGKGLKIDYAARVNAKKKVEKLGATEKADPSKKIQAKKEVKSQKDTKTVKPDSTASSKKKKEATTKPAGLKKETKKKSS